MTMFYQKNIKIIQILGFQATDFLKLRLKNIVTCGRMVDNTLQKNIKIKRYEKNLLSDNIYADLIFFPINSGTSSFSEISSFLPLG